MKWMFAPLLSLAACIPLPALADGNQLLSDCQLALNNSRLDVADGVRAGRCMGVVGGVADMSEALALPGKSKPGVCFPERGMRTLQFVRVVTRFLEDHPADLNRREADLAYVAILKAYPCPKE